MCAEQRQLDFRGQKFYIGIDVHKNKWVVSIRSNKLELKTFSMSPNPEDLSKFMNRYYPGGHYISGYEAGYFGFWIHRRLEQLCFKNIIFHAADIPTSHKEKVNKTDTFDSRKIARELENHSLKGIFVPDEFNQQLRSLNRLRHRYVQSQTRVKNRIKGHLSLYGIKIPDGIQNRGYWSGCFIKWLEGIEFHHQSARDYMKICLSELREHRRTTAEICRLLKQYVKEHGLSALIHRLCSIPGIAFITAITFYTEIIDINRFPDFDHFCSFVGLVPSLHNSGDKESNRGLTMRRNGFLRHMLVESSWVAVRKDPAILLSYTEYCQRMKKQEAIIRIAKKLLRRIRSVWKNDQIYVYGVVA